MNIHVLWPGQPNGLYHRESVQEDFLVVAGECLVLIEGEELALKAWDFVHCPGRHRPHLRRRGRGAVRDRDGGLPRGGDDRLPGLGARARTARARTRRRTCRRRRTRRSISAESGPCRTARFPTDLEGQAASSCGTASTSASVSSSTTSAGVDSSITAASTAPAGQCGQDVERDLEPVRQRGSAERGRPCVCVDVA